MAQTTLLLQLLLLVVAVAASSANQLPSNLTQLDANKIPQRYDEAQLWRIYNISEAMQQRVPVGQMLEQKFGGNIWKENSKFLDISIARDQLKAARSFLSAHRLDPQILSHNIQSMIDEELLEGIQSSSFGHGRRTNKGARSSMHWKDYHELETIYSIYAGDPHQIPQHRATIHHWPNGRGSRSESAQMQIKALDKSNNPLLTKRRKKIEEMEVYVANATRN
ncbi:GM12620 [Drosophila sechellia]|uniref:non-specific serine/threonine protein kinase n=1 Tax=Drosophila sechellia TaxID=7238 RepID=B4I0J8_DROSE|nr:GM12620 [Drosophila sechellia]